MEPKIFYKEVLALAFLYSSGVQRGGVVERLKCPLGGQNINLSPLLVGNLY